MSYNFTLIYNRQRPQNKTALIHGVRDNVPIIWYMLHYIEIHDDVNTSITGFPLELHWRLSIITKNVDVFALWLLRICSYIRSFISFILIFSFVDPELGSIPFTNYFIIMNFVTVINLFIDRMVKGYVVTFQKYTWNSAHSINAMIKFEQKKMLISNKGSRKKRRNLTILSSSKTMMRK